MSGLDVVELGCGTGRLSIPMAAAGANVTAVDFSDVMVAKARAKPGAEPVRFLKADLNRPLPFAGAYFDRVCSFLVLDHISEVDLMFREMARVCRPDGTAVISAMHPAIMLRGLQAHFHDPETGVEICPESPGNKISDYVLAANRAGLFFEHMSEHPIDEALAEFQPRVRKHLGWPLLLLMKLRRL